MRHFLLSLLQVPSVPSNDNCVHWTGNGTAIIQVWFHNVHVCTFKCTSILSSLIACTTTQSTLEYYGCNCCNDTRTFSLELATRKQEGALATALQLTIAIRYAKHLGLLISYSVVSVWQLGLQQSVHD